MSRLFFALTACFIAGAPRFVAAQEAYRFTPTSTFIARGDTVWWIRRTMTSARQQPGQAKGEVSKPAIDTIAYLIYPDSVVLFQPKPRRTLPPELAKHFRNILAEAKAAEKLDAKLGNRPKPGAP